MVIMVVHISKVRQEVAEVISIVLVLVRVFVIRKSGVSFLADNNIKRIKFKYVIVFYIVILFEFFKFYLDLNLRRNEFYYTALT